MTKEDKDTQKEQKIAQLAIDEKLQRLSENRERNLINLPISSIDQVVEFKVNKAMLKSVWKQWSALVSTCILIVSLFTIYLFILHNNFDRLEGQIANIQVQIMRK